MKLIKSILALAAAVFIGTSAQAAETENITLMASETAPAITTTATALKWYVTKDDTATERLDIKVERLVDSTAKVTITADGTEAGDKVAVLGLYGDGELVKTINVTITEKEDVAKFEQHVAIGETWTRTTVTKKEADNQSWRFNVNPNSYKATDNNYNTIAKLATYFEATVTGNTDGTATASIKGVAPADGKTFIIDLQYGRNQAYTTVQTITVVVDPAVADIKIPLNGSVETNGTYGTSTSDSNRHWVYNDLTIAGVVGLSLKKGNNNNFTVSDFSAPTGYEAYTKQTDWHHTFKATLTGNEVGADTVYIGRFYNGKDFVSECYKYNVYVYEEKITNITMKAGDTLPVVFESEAAGAWEVEGLAENDETVTLSAYAGWTAKSFATSITANKATEETKTFKVKNNFCIYTVNLTVEQGTEIKNISVAVGAEYNDTIEGSGTESSDDENVATIDLSDNLVTITGVAAGSTVCTIDPGYQYNVTVYSTVTNDALVGLGKTANINCTSDFEGAWTAQLAEGAEEGVVQIGNEWGESSTEFTLQLKGLKIGNTTLLVKNAYAQYTINVEVSAEVKNVDLKMEKGRTVTTNLTWGTSGVWTAVPKVGGDVATVELASQDPDTSNVAEVKAVMAGNSLWTISNGTHVAYTMNIKVWESIGLDPVSLLLDETNTLNLTSAAQASWTAVSSDENVATVTGSGVISTEFAPEIVAVGEGEATITVQNDYVKYEIIVTVEKQSSITICIEQGEGIAGVLDENSKSVDGDLELPAETTEVTLTLEADGLNVPVYKVVRDNVTNVTTKVATYYDIADGDTLEFFAEEADETDPTVTDDQIKQAIIDTIEDDDAAVAKVNAIVGAGAKQISARELAAWIHSNGIMSSDFGSSDYVVASAKLKAGVPITDENTEIEFVNGVSVTADGFVFDVSIVIDGRDPLELDEKMTNIVAACIQTTENLGTGFSEEKTVDVGRVEILDGMKVLIKPAAEPKSAEFFKFVIPPDPTGKPE